MLPPFNGGLHCGGVIEGAWAHVWSACSPPFNGGLHCGLARAVTAETGVFVLPPFNGGLHCGNISWFHAAAETFVLPPFNGGLQCGYVSHLPGLSVAVLHGVRRSWLRQAAGGSGREGLDCPGGRWDAAAQPRWRCLRA